MNSSATRFIPKADIVNVASVTHRSPFRYPGGKTWLVPSIRRWLLSLDARPRVFVEPFAGGAIVGLTIAAEGLVDRVVLGELDGDVAAVWRTILGSGSDAEWLVRRILRFEMNRENVISCLSHPPSNTRERAFKTIIRNRTQRGGILAPGASLVKNGENGKGVGSRWYPETLARRIRDIAELRDRIQFLEGDGFELIADYRRRKSAAFFIDPPYTAAGKRAGSRLYSYNELDHTRLFRVVSRTAGAAMLTYDDEPAIRNLASANGFQIETVPMKNTHHAVMNELVITNRGRCHAPPPVHVEQFSMDSNRNS